MDYCDKSWWKNFFYINNFFDFFYGNEMFNNDWKLLGVVKFGRNFVRDLGLIE